MPYLVAPSFAAAMLEHQVLRTIAVGLDVLLIADLGVGTGAELDGAAVQAVHQTGLVRVLAVEPAGGAPANWAPCRGPAPGRPGPALRDRHPGRAVPRSCQERAARLSILSLPPTYKTISTRAKTWVSPNRRPTALPSGQVFPAVFCKGHM